jgi:hypothetical protein
MMGDMMLVIIDDVARKLHAVNLIELLPYFIILQSLAFFVVHQTE